ncbi:MAG: M14 family metallopeptidase [bacterium]
MLNPFLIPSVILFMSVSTSWAITGPEEFLGHPVGADFKLARWEKIVDYFQLVGEQSDRVLVEQLGTSTEGSPYIMATVSSPDTWDDLDRFKRYQRWLSHPEELPEGKKEEVLRQAKTVILISCAIHSNEIASTQMAMELLHHLASGDDADTKAILDNTIILLVPAANPDGVNKVIDWYERSLGQPWEGRGMPWLYQKYVGHDNNRDWFMITQQETLILNQVLYHEWYPCILYDIHQMGNQSVRFFIPPFHDPVNPNIDPLISESLKMIGGHMATALAMEGKTGIASNAIYDMWWHGGTRTAPYRHNIIGILTEAASPLIASPVFQTRESLSGNVRGLQEYQQQINFSNPWEGGWWRLRDVIEYELIACKALFTLVSRYHDTFNRNYLIMGEKAIQTGREEPPYAFIIPLEQRDIPTVYHMLHILQSSGIEIHHAVEEFETGGVLFPAGTPVIYTAQPYRNHILDLLQPQEYPRRITYPGGPAERPYDVAGWTLSYQMGVESVPVLEPFEAETRFMESLTPPEGKISGDSDGDVYFSSNQSNNDFILLNRCFRNGIPVKLSLQRGPKKDVISPGSYQVDPKGQDWEKLEQWSRELGIDLHIISNAEAGDTSSNAVHPLSKPRLGLYQPWAASMDEGWTRFVLEQFEFDYQTLHNAEIRLGRLHERLDVILIPDMGTDTILNGMERSSTAPQYAGGIGEEGVMQVQEFVRNGGVLLCLDSASLFAIKYFDLPVKNALQGIDSKEFYCPGSILRVRLLRNHPLTYGMPETAAAFFAHSYAFSVESGNGSGNLLQKVAREVDPVQTASTTVPALYDDTVLLLSGWIEGREHIENKAALVSVPYGRGAVILYGFRVQHRAQTHGTFRLLFNGIVHHDLLSR